MKLSATIVMLTGLLIAWATYIRNPRLPAQFADTFQPIYRFLLRMTHSQEDARELAQETFLNAYQALPRWRADARWST